MDEWPNKSPEPTAVGACSSAIAVHVELVSCGTGKPCAAVQFMFYSSKGGAFL
jgi:hypothetical protein